MFFNYRAFIEEAEKKGESFIADYKRCYGEQIYAPLKEQPWYVDYAKKFDILQGYAVPASIEGNFDWDILQQITNSSFSSTVEIEPGSEPNQFEMTIWVENGGITVAKRVSELWIFQVHRLFEIYITEQMNLQYLIFTDKNEAAAIMQRRKVQLVGWSQKIKAKQIQDLGFL